LRESQHSKKNYSSRASRTGEWISSLEAEIRDRYQGLDHPIWPHPYNHNDAQAGLRFLTECWYTFNEADQEMALVPNKEYIREFAYHWFESRSLRQPLVIEKSRRLLISWICRGLETWQLGIKRGELVIVDQTERNAAEHLWRVDFALKELRSRHPKLGIPEHQSRGTLIGRGCTMVQLANGSLMTIAHQRAGAEQGKGKTDVILEELSRYRDPAGFWGQARIVTQGAAGGPGGWVCAICNASPNTAWRSIKEGVEARKLLGIEE
jgi:hypothetical protein